MGHPCLVPDFRGKISVFPIKRDINCEFILRGLYNIEISSLNSSFAEGFTTNGY